MKYIRVKVCMTVEVENEDTLGLVNVDLAVNTLAIALGYAGKYMLPGATVEVGFGKPPGVPGGLTRMGVFVPRDQGRTPRLGPDRRKSPGRRGAVSYSDRRGRRQKKS